MGGLPADSRVGQPREIEQGGATEGGRIYPQPNNPAISTTQELDEQRLPFHTLTTQPPSNLPGVAAQEDSIDLPHPTGERVLGEFISGKPITNPELSTDVMASIAEEEGQYVVFIKGNGLTLLQHRRRI